MITDAGTSMLKQRDSNATDGGRNLASAVRGACGRREWRNNLTQGRVLQGENSKGHFTPESMDVQKQSQSGWFVWGGAEPAREKLSRR